MSAQRPGTGLHVRITDERKPCGILVEARIVREGIVAPERDQPANPSMIALVPLEGRTGYETCEIEASTDKKMRTVTVEVIGWPVGMIALWSAYDRNMLRDLFTDAPFRWDGQTWWPLPGAEWSADNPCPMGHDGRGYPVFDAEAPNSISLVMGQTIWDGVVR